MPDIIVPSAVPDLTGRALFPHRHLLSIADLKPWEIRFLLDEAGTGAVAMMRAIKQALDPKNILNPGKIFQLQ